MMNADSAIWLYGSSARGDTDARSDYDVLAIGPGSEVPTDWPLNLSETQWARLSVSLYSWSQVESMASYGSLFLHHINIEGRPLWEGARARPRFRTVLKRLPAYQHIQEDLRAYRQAISDVRSSLCSGSSLPFELSVLATTLRHAGVLGCYVIGKPDFGRLSAIQTYAKCSALCGWTKPKIRSLLDYKLWSERRLALPRHVALERNAAEICDAVDLFINRVEGDARCRELIAA